MRGKNKLIVSLFVLFFVSLSLSIYTSFSSNIDTQEVIIKSMTPVYDETSDIVVDQTSVTFNDKNQVVKYNVVLENTQNYDVKIGDIILSTPTEEFLNYKVEGVSKDDVVVANSTKELIVLFETMGIDGWGRNFSDQLNTNVTFDKIPESEILPIYPDVDNPITGDIVLLIVSISVTAITGIALMIIFKKKFSMYTMVLIVFIGTISLVNAEQDLNVVISFNVDFNSQNVMKMAYTKDEEGNRLYHDYWAYNEQLKNFYISNEINEITEYAYKFDVTEKKNGRVFAYLVTNKNDSNYYDVYLQADGIVYPNIDASFYFDKMKNLDKIDNLNGFDTSEVINMRGMFQNAGYNSSVFTIDVSGFNTTNVTDMTALFNKTGYNSMFFTLDVSNFDTSKVTNMQYMFYGNGYNNPDFTLDVSNFDTSQVTSMECMFCSVGIVNPKFDLDVSNFDTSNVTNMNEMFHLTGYNSEIFTLDVSSFDTSKVVDMKGMFASTGFKSLVFSLDLSNFDTSNVTDMSYMFQSAGYSNPVFTLDVSSFDTSRVIDMSRMFQRTGYNSSELVLDVSNFDTNKVMSMDHMFSDAGYSSPVFTLDVSGFDTSNVTNMECMFCNTGYNSKKLNLDTSNFDTSKVTNVSGMFHGAAYNSLIFNSSITISNPNIEAYTNMFLSLATMDGTKMKVNYTNETEDLVDKLIATKSENSNVVKGNLVVDVDNLFVGD